jgi:hypothetical protein
MNELLIASADGHTTMPTDLWDQYLDKDHHRHLQRLREEQKMFSGTMEPLRDYRINRDSKVTHRRSSASGLVQNRTRNLKRCDLDALPQRIAF